MSSPGKMMIMAGVILILAGLLVLLFGRLGLGRIPGDIVIRKENFVFFFPLATMLILSAVLTLLLYLFRRFF